MALSINYQTYIAAGLYGPDAKSQFEFRFFFMLMKSSLGLLPIIIYWQIKQKKEQPLYGMKRKGARPQALSSIACSNDPSDHRGKSDPKFSLQVPPFPGDASHRAF